MTKFNVFKGARFWIATCNHEWASALTVCDCDQAFDTWEEAYDYAYKMAL